METKNTSYIAQYWTENTGGNCMVDFIQLKDGRVIGITDESICVYPSIEASQTGEQNDDVKCLFIC